MTGIEFEKGLSVTDTGIEGLKVVDLAFTATPAAGLRRTDSTRR